MSDLTALAEGLRAAVPFVRTLGIEYLEVAPDRAVLRLPDSAANHNHIGGPHAGAMFTLAESASGAVILAAYGDQLARATPLTTGAEVAYTKRAQGDVLATAVPRRTAAEVVAELENGGRPVIPVDVVLANADGAETGRVVVEWVLRANR